MHTKTTRIHTRTNRTGTNKVQRYTTLHNASTLNARMDFLKALSFSREGCFEPTLAKVDLNFSLHEIRSVILENVADVLLSAVHVSSPSLQSESVSSGSSGNGPSSSTQQLCPPGDSILVKSVPVDATLFVQVWAGQSVAEIEQSLGKSNVAQGARPMGGGISNLTNAGPGAPTRRIQHGGASSSSGSRTPAFAVSSAYAPLFSTAASARYAGEVRIPMSALLADQVLYYAWLQLDTMADTIPNLHSAEVMFEQAMYAGPRNAQQPKICVSLCRDAERGRGAVLPLKLTEEDTSFKARLFAPLLKSHQQHVCLAHVLSMELQRKEGGSLEVSGAGKSVRNEEEDQSLTASTVVQQQLETSQRRATLLEGVVEDQKSQLSGLRQNLDRVSKEHEAQTAELRRQAIEASQRTHLLEGELEDTRSSDQQRREQQRTTQEELSKTVDKLRKENDDLLRRSNAKIEDANTVIVNLRNEKDELARKCDNLLLAERTAQIDFEQQRDGLKAQIESLRSRATGQSEAAAQLTTLMEERATARQERDAAIQERDAVIQERDELRQTIVGLEAQKKTLTDIIAGLYDQGAQAGYAENRPSLDATSTMDWT
ncbi:unnamed protein product [Amoebophrya sp. A25]|nr:unnamed protein product [Amoebophrya sp. A25]|eukprot:GSA25T00027204001.1